jgi:hypothetical protein
VRQPTVKITNSSPVTKIQPINKDCLQDRSINRLHVRVVVVCDEDPPINKLFTPCVKLVLHVCRVVVVCDEDPIIKLFTRRCRVVVVCDEASKIRDEDPIDTNCLHPTLSIKTKIQPCVASINLRRQDWSNFFICVCVSCKINNKSHSCVCRVRVMCAINKLVL